MFLMAIVILSGFANAKDNNVPVKNPIPDNVNLGSNQINASNKQKIPETNRIDKLVDRVILERQMLSDESKRQFEMVKYIFEQERNTLENILEKVVWIIGAIGALVSFIIYRIFGEQKSFFQKITNDNESKIKELQTLTEEAKNSLLLKVKELDLLAENVSNREREINTFLEAQDEYKHKNIIWIYGEKNTKDIDIINSLKKKNIKNVYEVLLGDQISFDKINYHAVVVSISNNSNIDDSFLDLIKLLKNNNEPPLVVYTYNEGQQIRLLKEQWDILDKYENYTVANFPGSLQTTLNNILRWL